MNNKKQVNYSTVKEVLDFLQTPEGKDFKGTSITNMPTTTFKNAREYEPVINLGNYYFGIIKINPENGSLSASAYTRTQLVIIDLIPQIIKTTEGSHIVYKPSYGTYYTNHTGLWWLPEERDITNIKTPDGEFDCNAISNYILSNVAIDHKYISAETKKALIKFKKTQAKTNEQPEA